MNKKPDHMTMSETIVFLLSLMTIPFIAWWSIIPIFFSMVWIGGRIQERQKDPFWQKDVSLDLRQKWEEPAKNSFTVGKVEETEEKELNILSLTDHAKRTLAIRHGVISPVQRLNYDELTKFEEEGEDVYITKFWQLNKSKDFAVVLDSEKKVILTFYPHTDYDRNRAYFKKYTNLDSSLKDDVTKSLKELQEIWINKIV